MSTTIDQKLFNIQQEVGKIVKDSKNPYFNSKYFDINTLIEVLNPYFKDNRILLKQPLNENVVHTVLLDIETGETVRSSLELPDISDPQKIGSAITYYRRYTLQSLLGLQAEDDDANYASGNVNKEKRSNEIPDDNKPWLNLYDKAGNETKKFKQLRDSVDQGNSHSLKGIRKKFKVSREDAKTLKEELNIE